MRKILFVFLLLFAAQGLKAQNFDIIPLGVLGGEQEDNLSAYLVGAHGTDRYICLDAGTINTGIRKALSLGSLKGSVEQVLKEQIKGYFVSHGHLDHIAGLIINSPADAAKNIYAIGPVVRIMQTHYFIGDTWVNFADAGESPRLNKFHYVTLNPAEEVPLDGTALSLKAYTLSHVNPYQSSAALINSGGKYLLYLGDTGADRIEKSDKLSGLWHSVAPLISAQKLRTIMIEVSFPDSQPEKLLFGHLTPTLLNEEMQKLAALIGPEAIRGLNVVITHRKPGGDNINTIAKELNVNNPLKLNFIYPEQGRAISVD